jgi:hypothetical protein
MFTDEAVLWSATPISSAIAMKRLLNSSSMTGSTRVPMAGADTRGTARVRMRLSRGSTSACQPGSMTVVAEGSIMRAGPGMRAPVCRVERP